MPSLIQFQLEPDEYIVSPERFQEVASPRISEILGLSFPIRLNTSLNESMLLKQNEVVITPQLISFLKEQRCLVLNNPGWLTFSLGHGEHATWHVKDKFVFFEKWSPTATGISITLDTQHPANDSTHEDVAKLALLVNKFWSSLHPNVLALAASQGKHDYSWDEVGIEPSISMDEFYESFLEDLAESYGTRVSAFASALARSDQWNPLTPSPLSPGRVPISRHDELKMRWLKQLSDFGDTHLPQIPSDPPPLT